MEFTYQPPAGSRTISQLITESKIADNVKDKSIDVYPNPASSYIIVYDYPAQQSRQIELVDVSGHTVKKQTTVNLATRIEVNDLVVGLYILKVKDRKGKVIRTEKIIILR